LDREGYLLTLLLASALVWRSRSDGCVKGDIGGRSISGTSGNVSTAFTFGTCSSAASALPAGEAIKLTFNASWNEGLAYLDFIAALPPACLKGIQGGLPGRFGLPFLFTVFDGLTG
jgi:hypothetical protein